MSNAAAYRRLRVREWVGSATGFLAVLATLVVLDPRVSHQFSRAFYPSPAEQLLSWGQRLADLSHIVLVAMRDQGITHAPILVMTAVAALLVGFMLRT